MGIEGVGDRGEKDDRPERDDESLEDYIRKIKEKYPELEEPRASERSDSEPHCEDRGAEEEFAEDDGELERLREQIKGRHYESEEFAEDKDIPWDAIGEYDAPSGEETKSLSDSGRIKETDEKQSDERVVHKGEKEYLERQPPYTRRIDEFHDEEQPGGSYPAEGPDRVASGLHGYGAKNPETHTSVDDRLANHARPEERNQGETDDTKGGYSEVEQNGQEFSNLRQPSGNQGQQNEMSSTFGKAGDFKELEKDVKTANSEAKQNDQDGFHGLPESISQKDGDKGEANLGERHGTPSLIPPESSHNHLAVITSRAYFSSSDGDQRVQFVISESRLEHEAQTKLENGKIYQIRGKVAGVYDFEVCRVKTEGTPLNLYVPKEYQERLKAGERYELIISSIQEVKTDLSPGEVLTNLKSGISRQYLIDSVLRSETEDLKLLRQSGRSLSNSETKSIQEPFITSVAHSSFGKGFRLTVRKHSFEELIETRLEKGKLYEIKATVEGIGSFRTHHLGSERPTVYLNIPNELNDRIKIGKRYGVAIESIREKREHNVEITSHGPTIRIYKTTMELAGLKSENVPKQNEIIEFQGKNLARPDLPIVRCFATYRYRDRAGSAEVDLRVGRLGAKPKDVFEFYKIARFTMNNYVEEFKLHRPRAIENMKLAFHERKLMMDVDGKKFQLREPRLTTNKLQVVLRAKVDKSDKEIKLWFDGEKITPRFLQNWPIHSFKAYDYGLEISYSMSRNDARTFRLKHDKFDRRFLIDRVTFLPTPKNSMEPYRFEVAPELQECIRFRVLAERDPYHYRYEKGDISEEVQRYLLARTGLWDEAAYHPFDKTWRTHESRKTGPDSLQRSRLSGELFYFEFKWDQNVEDAHSSASRQDMKYLKAYPTYEGEKVKGAYTGILDWDVTKQFGKFYVRKVWPVDIERS